MPVILVDDIKKAEITLGYKYVPYLERFKETFTFFHLEGDQNEVIKSYNLKNIPSILIFKEIMIEGKKTKRAAFYD